MHHRVIFLDIDGVLNSANFIKNGGSFDNVDPVAVARLRRAIEATKAVLVISSTWRLNKDWENRLRSAFTVAGWGDPPIIGRTPSRRSRGVEIAEWLQTNPVEDFVIIDDDIFDMLPEHQAHVIKCSFSIGLSEENVKIVEERWK